MADWQSAPPPGVSNPVAGQPVPLQPVVAQAQPQLQPGMQFYAQPYPVSEGIIVFDIEGTLKLKPSFKSSLLNPHPLTLTTQAQVVLAQPQQAVMATGHTTNLPKYAFVTSLVATIIFTMLFWLPGLLCLVPATVLSIVVS